MAFILNKTDRKALSSIAEHRVLTLSQVTAIQQKSRQVVRRRLRALEGAGLILSATRSFGQSRGRPEKLVSLTETGIDLLRSESPALRRIPNSNLTAEKLRCLDHQLLVNWFRIHLGHLERVIPQLSVQFLAPTSPYLKQDHKHRPFIFEHLPREGRRHHSNGFIPDGVLRISHKERKKALLFFLEVDMGTETVASLKRGPEDIRQKVLNYQRYFQSRRYKRYEKTWNSRFNGFRLLFLANTTSRLTLLCRLIQEMPPSGFIWATDLEQMFSQGLSAETWVRGGRQDASPESILGASMACSSPILPLMA